MKTLNVVLMEDQSKKSKPELIAFLTILRTLLTPPVYEKINGVQLSELEELTKKEILDIITVFKDNYVEEWENYLKNASPDILKAILGLVTFGDAVFAISGVSDAEFNEELGSIDFASIIGGPLEACVKAQTNASLTTINFIKEVGFETSTDGKTEIRMVDFSYSKTVKDTSTDPPTDKIEPVTLKVPFISILNIPSFRIETCEINFNVKLNSTYTKEVKNDFKIGAGASGGWGPVKFKVDVSYQRTSSTGIKVEKEYSLGVKVRATNDEMPKGLEKVLGLLAN